MTVSIDGHPRHGVGTGISASDRAKTVQIAVDPRSTPDDLLRPGHMVPLRARSGGVLVRTGQTEGSVDLARLAGLRPAAVISEACREDGEMARLPDLERLCAQHKLKMCSVEQIIEYRLARETLIERMPPEAGTCIETPYGRFTLFAYHSAIDALPHLALTVGGVGEIDPATRRARPIEAPVLVRVHRRDLLGDVFDEASNPTGPQLRQSLKQIQQSQRGVLVYLRSEGAGDDLRDTLQRIRRPIGGVVGVGGAGGLAGVGGVDDLNTPDLMSADGIAGRIMPRDWREIGIGGQILRDLGVMRMRLLSNHPRDYPGLHGFGLEIIEQVAIEDSARAGG
jgi:3,4-dihydroxy 2-butanone 4-phosphate synthase/GTP cyclohydrolase II